MCFTLVSENHWTDCTLQSYSLQSPEYGTVAHLHYQLLNWWAHVTSIRVSANSRSPLKHSALNIHLHSASLTWAWQGFVKIFASCVSARKGICAQHLALKAARSVILLWLFPSLSLTHEKVPSSPAEISLLSPNTEQKDEALSSYVPWAL